MRAKRFIPNGCQTLSKQPERYIQGIYPKMLVSGHGAEVYDEDGKRYIDYISSLGAIVLGYNHPSVDDAVKETISAGQVLLSLPHPKEGKLAERLSKLTHYDQVKFFKTGSEATSAAIRLARAFTGRSLVLSCGYNGWHDWAAAASGRRAGIPDDVINASRRFRYNDIGSLEAAIKDGAAAVILEPVVFDPPTNGFIEQVVSCARNNGALVIFDEIVNGMRFGVSGAGSWLGHKADIICLGKSLGNGFPISALLGSTELMSVFERDDFIASGTFSGDLVGISAALATIERLNPDTLWANGNLLKVGFNCLIADMGLDAACVGYAPRTCFRFPTDTHKFLFWQECAKMGVLFGYTNFVTQSHGHIVLNETLNVCKDALVTVKSNWKDPALKMEGPLPQKVM